MTSRGIQRRCYTAICRSCGAHRRLSRPDYRPVCPHCAALSYMRRRYRAHRAHVLDLAKAHRHKARVRIARYMRAYRRRRRHRLSVQKREWNQRHADHIRAYTASYYRENRAVLVRRVARWRATHKAQCAEHARAAQHRRRALKRGSRVGRVRYAFIRRRDHGRCGLCRQRVTLQNVHYDHIIPLSRGGPHTENNVQLAHPRCNLLKWAKIIPQEPAMTSGRR